MNVKVIFATFIKSQRAVTGMTQEQFGLMCGLSKQVIQKIENYEISTSIDHLVKIFNSLEFDFKILNTLFKKDQYELRTIRAKRDARKHEKNKRK